MKTDRKVNKVVPLTLQLTALIIFSIRIYNRMQFSISALSRVDCYL